MLELDWSAPTQPEGRKSEPKKTRALVSMESRQQDGLYDIMPFRSSTRLFGYPANRCDCCRYCISFASVSQCHVTFRFLEHLFLHLRL